MNELTKYRLVRHIERAALIACLLLLVPISAAAQGGRCTARIEVQLDAEVSNPRDPSFMSSLTASPLYSLTWVEGDESRAVYVLTGPGTDDQCKAGIDIVRRASSILDLRVLDPGSSN
jgi:hypothetical protein